MNIEKPYICESEQHGRYATVEEAISAACEMKLAPFVIYQMIAQPIAQRLTNMDMPQKRNGEHL